MTARPTPIRLAVLDMAGTTVADGGLVEAAFGDAMAAVGITAADPAMPGHLQVVRDTMGQSKIVVFRRLLGEEARAQQANAAFERAYADRVRDGHVRALPGAEALLATLREQGVKIALTTGFAAPTRQAIIDHLGWSGLVDGAFSPGAGVRGRPHPDLVLTALMALEIDDVAALAVAGDTVSDLQAGTAAGASLVAGVLTGAHDRATLEGAPHTHILDSVADLGPLIAERR